MQAASHNDTIAHPVPGGSLEQPSRRAHAPPRADQHPCRRAVTGTVYQILFPRPTGQSLTNNDPWGADHPLTKHLGRLISTSLAQATKNTYATGMRQFIRFCKAHGAPSLPASKTTLSHFATQLSLKGLSPSTINGYLAAVRTKHRQLGLPDPDHRNHTLTLVKRGPPGHTTPHRGCESQLHTPSCNEYARHSRLAGTCGALTGKCSGQHSA